MKNMPEDLKACEIRVANNKNTAASLPALIIIIGIAMWIIELNATICFISVFVKTINLITKVPTTDTIPTKSVNLFEFMRNHIRVTPIPPSFRRIPARIIDPYTGAST